MLTGPVPMHASAIFFFSLISMLILFKFSVTVFWQLSEERKKKRTAGTAKVPQVVNVAGDDVGNIEASEIKGKPELDGRSDSQQALPSAASAKGDRFLTNLKPSFNFKDGGNSSNSKASGSQLPRAASSKGDRFWSNLVPSFIIRDKQSSEAGVEGV